MTLTVTLLIAALIFAVAVLYSTVGHAGASGYLAAMALFGFGAFWLLQPRKSADMIAVMR